MIDKKNIHNYLIKNDKEFLIEDLNIINENEIFFKCKSCYSETKTSYKNIKRRIRENRELLCQTCNKIGEKNPSFGKNPYNNLTKEEYNKLLKTKSNNAKKTSLALKGYKSQTNRLSKIHIQLINILNDMNIKNKFDTEYNIENYFYDEGSLFYKLIIEVNGDYFHANPEIYDENFYVRGKWKSYKAKDKWEYDKHKADKAVSYGFKVLTIWEKDFKQIDYVKNLIKEAINGKP